MSRRGSSSKPSYYIFPATSDAETHFDPNLELYEADLWDYSSSGSANNTTVTEPKKKKKKKKKMMHQPKREGCKEHLKNRDDDEDDGDGDGGEGGGVMIPPHEYLARMIGTPNSVQEGKGRTLKGWHARNLRNDVWKKTGFEG